MPSSLSFFSSISSHFARAWIGLIGFGSENSTSYFLQLYVCIDSRDKVKSTYMHLHCYIYIIHIYTDRYIVHVFYKLVGSALKSELKSTHAYVVIKPKISLDCTCTSGCRVARFAFVTFHILFCRAYIYSNYV